MMKKRLASAVCALVMMGGMIAVPLGESGFSFLPDVAVSAEELVYGDYTYMVRKDGTVEISKYNGKSEVVEIPDSIDGKPVTSIGYYAFAGCKLLKSVTIPDGVKNIGLWAFRSCTGLKSVNLPNSITSIGDYAFEYCSSLTSVTIPDGVTSIRKWSFHSCTSLKSVTIPDSVTNIGEYAFYNCTSLTNVNIPDNVVKIWGNAFDNCCNLQTISGSQKLDTICRYAFCNCSSLKSIVIPRSVTTIEDNALGYYYDAKTQAYVKYDNFKIYCIKGSAGEKYAIDNGFEYELLDVDVIANPEVTFTPDFNSIDLTWTEVEGAEKYAVCGIANDGWKMLAEVEGTSYMLEKLKSDQKYKIAVIAMLDGKWNQNYSNATVVKTKCAYPEYIYTRYDSQYHQFKLNWSNVPNAQNYGVAVYLEGKWKVQKQDIPATTTSFTSPKLKAGKTYKVLVCAKIDGKWNLSDLSSRVYTVTVK